jgi:hypothetical protein
MSMDSMRSGILEGITYLKEAQGFNGQGVKNVEEITVFWDDAEETRLQAQTHTEKICDHLREVQRHLAALIDFTAGAGTRAGQQIEDFAEKAGTGFAEVGIKLNKADRSLSLAIGQENTYRVLDPSITLTDQGVQGASKLAQFGETWLNDFKNASDRSKEISRHVDAVSITADSVFTIISEAGTRGNDREDVKPIAADFLEKVGPIGQVVDIAIQELNTRISAID